MQIKFFASLSAVISLPANQTHLPAADVVLVSILKINCPFKESFIIVIKILRLFEKYVDYGAYETHRINSYIKQ